MVFYIRDSSNTNVFEAEFWVKAEGKTKNLEIKCSVCIAGYSKLLLANASMASDIIKDFSELDELRGWMWECFFASKRNDGSNEDYMTVLEHIRLSISVVASKYGLRVVED